MKQPLLSLQPSSPSVLVDWPPHTGSPDLPTRVSTPTGPIATSVTGPIRVRCLTPKPPRLPCEFLLPLPARLAYPRGLVLSLAPVCLHRWAQEWCAPQPLYGGLQRYVPTFLCCAYPHSPQGDRPMDPLHPFSPAVTSTVVAISTLHGSPRSWPSLRQRGVCWCVHYPSTARPRHHTRLLWLAENGKGRCKLTSPPQGTPLTSSAERWGYQGRKLRAGAAGPEGRKDGTHKLTWL